MDSQALMGCVMSRTDDMDGYVSATDPGKFKGQFRLIFPMAAAELKAESGHSFGGMLWWFVDPLLSILVYYIAFSFILQNGGKDFIAFLCVGTLTWRWFQCSLLRGAGAIMDATAILHKVYVHKSVLVGVCLLADALKFLVTLLPLCGFVMLLGYTPSLHWIALPLVILTQGLFITACVGCLAALTPLMPDLRNMLQHVLQLLIFVSGVFFDVTLISPQLKRLVRLNPMTGILQGYRDCLLYRQWPDALYLGTVMVVSLAGMAVAWKILQRFDREYTKVC